MNGSVASVTTLVNAIVARGFGEKADCFLCPSFVHVKLVSDILNNASSNIELGAQDLSEQNEGAFTGEVSGEMLSDLGAGLVLVGHSERRQRFDEKDYMVAAKYKAARAVGLIPVLCVGETQTERENGETEKVVGRQLRVIVEECGSELMKGSIVAYEPIWAIGTGLTATPEQAQAVEPDQRRRQVHGDRRAGEAQTRAVEVVLPDDVVDQVVPEDRRVGVDRHDGERVGLKIGEGHIDRVADREPQIGGRILVKGDAGCGDGAGEPAADDVGIEMTLNIVDVGREDVLVPAVDLN